MAKIPSISMIPSGYKKDKIYSVLPTSGAGDFDFTRSSTATRVNARGLIETVATGVPRLEYTLLNGVVNDCPSLLLEPQSSNLITYSEDFTQSSWTSLSGAQLSATTTVTPSGSTNAVRVKNVGGANNDLRSLVSITSGLTYTSSVYIRRVSGVGSVIFRDVNNGGNSITLTSEWQKFYSTVLSTSGNGRFYLELSTLDDEIEVWGAQLEQQSYATSYIPTSGSAVTRVADTASGSGDASTFNSLEGVLYAEISALADDLTNRFIILNDGSISNRLTFRYRTTSNQISMEVHIGGTEKFSLEFILNDITVNQKIALKYKKDDYALWVNGVEVSTSALNDVFTANTLNNIDFKGFGQDFYGNTKQLQYYDSALNDSELETLTSWTSFTEMANGQSYTIK